jgi:mono/diheme cytochrome c family protein
VSTLKKVGIAIGGLLAVSLLGLGAAVAYAAVASQSKLHYPDTAYPDITASTDPAVIERGRYLVNGPAHCMQCHSSADREHPETVLTTAPHGGMLFDMGIAQTWAPNITPDAETGIGRYSDKEVARTIRTGVRPNGDLSIFMYGVAKPSDEDLTAIVSYLRSVPPEKNVVPEGQWSLIGRVVLVYMFPPMAPKPNVNPKFVPEADEPSVERGEYIANNLALCVVCHTDFDMSTFENTGPKGAGGMVEGSHGKDSDKEFAPPNLTSSPTGITGKLSEDAFLARIRAGRVYTASIMPWENIGTMTDSDLRSVYRYLKSLPPVDRDTGPSYRPLGWTPPAK